MNASGGLTVNGLDGVVVAETRLSEVDGERGRLVIGGFDVESLAGRASFEDAAAILLAPDARRREALPESAEREAVRAALARARTYAFDRIDGLGDALRRDDGMDALRASVAHLVVDAGADPAISLAGALGVYVAAWARTARGLAPIAPDPASAHAADILRMISGAPRPAPFSDALDAYLVTVVDHGMNASTFTARVIASTGSDIVSAVVGAIGALKGPLHGGAPGPVLDMLDAIGSPDRAAAWIDAELAAGRRIMGMGHRIYRVRDPRAAVLEKAILVLETADVVSGRLALARAVERAAEGALASKYPDRPLRANVEFYTAVLLDAIGVPRAAFTPMFAASRVVGWCAHFAEQRAHGRLIRPGSRYVGAMPEASAQR